MRARATTRKRDVNRDSLNETRCQGEKKVNEAREKMPGKVKKKMKKAHHRSYGVVGARDGDEDVDGDEDGDVTGPEGGFGDLDVPKDDL